MVELAGWAVCLPCCCCGMVELAGWAVCPGNVAVVEGMYVHGGVVMQDVGTVWMNVEVLGRGCWFSTQSMRGSGPGNK